MVYCNRDMCIFNYDDTCTKKDVVLSVKWDDESDKEVFTCVSYHSDKE